MPHVETFINGIWYPSVTTVMGAEPKPWLDKWHEKWGVLADRKIEAASTVGTEFHRCVESYLDTGCYSFDRSISYAYYPRLNGMMRSFISWAVSVDGIVCGTELKVISKLHTYSGTLDAVGTLDGKPIIFDWKTSSRIYPEMQLQLSAYAQAYEEQTGQRIPQGIIVHVSKDKPHYKVTTKTFKLGKRVFKKFLKLREMFDAVQEVAVSTSTVFDTSQTEGDND